jgi:hypothetical protein
MKAVSLGPGRRPRPCRAEPPGNKIAHTSALGDDGRGVAEALARAPGASGADEADERPARRRVPAQLELGDTDVVVLVAALRQAADVDERQLVERDLATRGAAVEPRAEDETARQRRVREEVRAVGLEAAVAADRRGVEQRVDDADPAARGGEDVVARVVFER